MSESIIQCWCVCGRKNVLPDDTRNFVCECGRHGEVDWRAEIDLRSPGEQQKAVS